MSDYKSPETPPVYGSQPGYPGYDQNAPPQGYPPQGYPPQGYPPQGYPPQGYPPQGYVTTTTVVPSTAVVITTTSPRFGPNPVQCVCPFCKNQIVTSTQYDAGALVWLTCVCLFFFTFCCFFLAFVIDDLKDVVHTCPSCRNVVGRYNRM